MKNKTLLIAFCIILICSNTLPAKVQAGIFVNYLNISDTSVKDAYGAGITFTPFLELTVIHGFFIGGSYDIGYNKTADIGLLNEKSTFTIQGGDLFLGYNFGKKPLVPYIKGGAGRYTYEQEIESTALNQNTITETKIVWMIGGGIKYHFAKFLSLNVELKYSPFHVDGAGDKQLNIGGIKAGAGISLRL